MKEISVKTKAGAQNRAPEIVFTRPFEIKVNFQDRRDTIRKTAAEQIHTIYKSARQEISSFIEENPFSASTYIRAQSDLTDDIVNLIFLTCLNTFGMTSSTSISVLAVGGYGRSEMAPFSDVDLLFLTKQKPSKTDYEIIEMMLYILWDLKLKLGHSTRSIKDCISLGKQDQTIKTSLLEMRHVCGDEVLFKALSTRMDAELFDSAATQFVEEKLDERAKRHKRQGNQRYLLEPNIKEGKGGLRDLQSMFWILKYLSSATSHEELIRLGYFSEEEYNVFEDAYNFLWSTRCQMHLISKRASEKLTFDLQVEVARNLGYSGDDAMRGVEYFMQDYFRHATSVGELTRVFLTELEARHVKKSVSTANKPKKFWKGHKKAPDLSPPFAFKNERVTIADISEFQKNPVNILKLFQEGLRTSHLIHPEAMRIIRANLNLIDEKMRLNPKAREIFLSLLLDYGDPARALRRMNELEVLGAFIPEFKRIIALMQFNIYHHYTVDEHIIQCVSILAQIEKKLLREELPIVSTILEAGVNRRILYVAMLLHDIGKGLPEDHSVAGARIANEVAPALGLDESETETVVWLVENHLLMSDFAQKRDLSDPRTVGNFVAIVKTTSRLNLLTALTTCDIMGVGPGTLTSWKAQLLRDLYFASKEIITGGLDKSGKLHSVQNAKDALGQKLSDWESKDLDKEYTRHYDAYWQGLDTDAHVTFAKLLRDYTADEVFSEFSIDDDREATRAFFVLQDHPGIFSRISGALALVNANVVDARTYTSSDGYATPVFWIQDQDGKPFDSSNIKRLKRMVIKTLSGDIIAGEQFSEKNKLKKREKPFRVPTEISFDNEGSEIYTIIEVDTRDRPSLLFDLTRTLTDANIQIASAVIATYGAQAVDVFYVKDMFGLKLHSKAKQDIIRKRLQTAIEKGARAAML